MPSAGELTKNSVVTPARRVAFRQIGGKMVVVVPGDNRVITLNETATAIWPLLDGRTVEAVARSLAGEFDTDFEQALADTLAFLETMLERDAVVLADANRS